ncbi:uncharacterized protein LOC129907752 [Episyrphus balteatus]|uniref:uncharacterized protein LOC129907752 n=1 Tax=Episyrphus balteatus TaxID=286459 RepID=UPI00248601C1|nr:uncharacterized protein LOC129907752 [Episyrphus balteatus]
MSAKELVKLLVQALKENSQQGADQTNDVNYQIMPDFNKSIQNFNGKKNDCEARDWLLSVDAVADLNRWSDAFRLECVRFHLVGAAKSWYNSLTISTWAKFKSEFESTFTSPLDTADRWKLLLERKQRKGEDIIDYFFEKLRMCNDLKLSFTEIKTQIIDGIISRELKQFLLCRSHTNTNEVVRDIKNHFQLMGPSASESVPTKRIGGEYKSHSSVPERCSKCKGGHKDEFCTQGKAKDEIKCFRCLTPGHYKSECKVEVKCIHCGNPGHMMKNCPKSKTDFRTPNVTSNVGKSESSYKVSCVRYI